jgi:hypothetical protein
MLSMPNIELAISKEVAPCLLAQANKVQLGVLGVMGNSQMIVNEPCHCVH